jgi:hypothetical protein
MTFSTYRYCCLKKYDDAADKLYDLEERTKIYLEILMQ